MSARIEWAGQSPSAYKAMLGLEQALEQALSTAAIVSTQPRIFIASPE